jgi:hypothetical protein
MSRTKKDTVDKCQRVEARVNLCHAYSTLVDVLGRLARGRSAQAAYIWQYMPSAAPVGSATTLRRACVVANAMPPPLDCLPEWDAYLAALTEFAAAPLFGPAPMPIPDGALAALDNGSTWVFRR